MLLLLKQNRLKRNELTNFFGRFLTHPYPQKDRNSLQVIIYKGGRDNLKALESVRAVIGYFLTNEGAILEVFVVTPTPVNYLP